MELEEQFFIQAGFEKVEPLSATLLLLHPKKGRLKGLAVLWHIGEGAEQIMADIRQHQDTFQAEMKLYFVYKGYEPYNNNINWLRMLLNYEAIPLPISFLEKSVSIQRCEEELQELEEPYLTRRNPYTESKPIHDPIWFYGREEFLQRLPPVLAWGQHIGLFGLRKVGKTSLANQLRQRFGERTPAIFIDCQGISAKADIYFEEILINLHAELRSLNVEQLPQLPETVNRENFRRQFLALFDRWEELGHRKPFLIIFDEIDKLFPIREADETILREYLRLFGTLRGLAQSRRCLVTLVIAYRPDVNRYNLFPHNIGENPMFALFQEEYLGFLNLAESETMITEIGMWKNIVWDVEAARQVFHYCGGHPLVTRYFASEACERGMLKQITYSQVENTAKKIQKKLRTHQIGTYYYRGVWEMLRKEEQELLCAICRNGNRGFSEENVPDELIEALTNLEHFGLVINEDGILRISAHLFDVWLRKII
jgi:hypothetical protein